MEQLWTTLERLATAERLLGSVKAAALVLVGLTAAWLLGRLVQRLAAARFSPQQAIWLRRAAYYLVLGLFVVAALQELGFKLGVLMGAAGVLSVAAGFASQTSASNLVSGLFLIAERPFGQGDVIQVGGTTGEVLSIDLLSVKLRTFDNQYVRVPNESLIKSEVRTLTRFPIRRVDLQIGVAYKEDIDRVIALLLEIADRHPLCLDEPQPVIIFSGFGDSAIQLQFSPWVARQNFLELKNSIQIEIKRRFDEEGIEIPFPHVTLYTGAETEPFPLAIAERSRAEHRAPSGGGGETDQ